MPDAGYGQYPVNKTAAISEDMLKRIVDAADRLKVSHSEVMRRALDHGLTHLEGFRAPKR